jgi:hypothetical protein
MRVAHKVAVLTIVIIFMLLALLLPRAGHAGESAFGDYVVHYSAISTEQLFPAAAASYGIERSPHNGLVNIAVEHKSNGADPAMIAASISGKVADLTGHSHPIRFRETREDGAVDYLGEFAIDSAGTYVFTIDVTPPGGARAYTLRFNQDYVVD